MMTIQVEVFVASQLLSRTQGTFTTGQLRRDVKRLFCDTRPGMSTHASSHCVANARRNAGTVYNYLWRLAKGLFRVFDPSTDQPHPTRANASHLPNEDDVPVEYRYLLRQAID